MDGGGTLKKRRKRPIAKVTGLSTILYNDEDDWLKGYDLRNIADDENPKLKIRNITPSSHEFKLGKTFPNGSRPTRDPNFSFRDERKESFVSLDSSGLSTPNKEKTEKKGTQLLSNHTIFKLKFIVVLGAASGAVPWYWCGKRQRIETWHPFFSKLWRLLSLLYFLQTSCLTVFQVWVFYHRIVEQEERDFRAIFQSSFGLFWYVCAVYFYINLVLYKDEMRQCINTLLEFNEELTDKYVITLEGYEERGSSLSTFFVYCNTIQVFVSVSFFCGLPQLPHFLISYIITPQTPWFYLIPGALQEFAVIGQVIFSFIITSWAVVAHSNSVGFWAAEIHKNNESGFTKNELRHPLTTIKIYRSLQILCACFNDCMSPLAIPMIKLHMISGLIPCGYVLVKSIDPEIFVREFPGILTYPVAYIDGVSVSIAILSLPAIMHDLATGFIDSWSRTKNMDYRKILISFPTLKIKVGRLYHITSSTTITYFKVLTDFIIDVIITFK